MGTFHTSIRIDRPMASVFALLADPGQMPRWYDAVTAAHTLTPGPAGPGTHIRLLRALPAGPVENEVEVTEFQPVRRFTLTSRQGPTPFQYRYRLDPIDGGSGTRLTLDAEITIAGLPGAAALAAIATTAFKHGMARNLGVFKRLVEAA